MKLVLKKSVNIVAVITLITILCKIFGFFKNSVLAYYYGTSYVIDAYVMTFSIGTITSSWIVGLIGNFTPKFKEIEANSGRKEALIFSGQVFRFVLFLVVLLIVLLEIFSPIIVRLIAPGFEYDSYSLTVAFFRIYCISIFFYAIFRFSQEFLNCNQNHLAAVAPDLLMSSFCIIAIVVSSILGNYILIMGYVIAILMQGGVTFICSKRLGLVTNVKLAWNDNVQGLIKMAVPVFFSDALSNINNLVDKIFASRLNAGTIAALDYANTMKDFAYQVGTIGIATMMFPVISKLWADGNVKEFKDKIMQSVSMFSVVYIPLIVAIIYLGDLVIKIVFQRGAFTSESTIITTNAFIVYSVGLIPMVYRLVFYKAFFAMQQTNNVLFVSFFNVLLNVILNIILVNRLGYLGLVIATTTASIICMPLNFWIYSRSISGLEYRDFFITFFKCLLAGLVMFVAMFCIRNGLNLFLPDTLLTKLLVLALTGIFGIMIYCVICTWLKVDGIKRLLSTITWMKF